LPGLNELILELRLITTNAGFII